MQHHGPLEILKVSQRAQISSYSGPGSSREGRATARARAGGGAPLRPGPPDGGGDVDGMPPRYGDTRGDGSLGVQGRGREQQENYGDQASAGDGGASGTVSSRGSRGGSGGDVDGMPPRYGDTRGGSSSRGPKRGSGSIEL